ncbi:hypothetical protein JCM5350_000321 [Sporobolomyces pararoseus]
MDSFAPRSDSQADIPVRLTRSKRLKAQSEGEQDKESQHRPRRNRTPARIFSPERWNKKEKRDEKLTKEPSFATLGIDLDLTTESNRLLSRNSSFVATQIFNYTCLKTEDSLSFESKEQQQDDYDILLRASFSPTTRIPSPVQSDSTEINFSPLEFLCENLSPLLSPIASPTQSPTSKQLPSSSSRSPLGPVLLPFPLKPIRLPSSKTRSPRKLSPSALKGIFSDSSYYSSLECATYALQPPKTAEPPLATIDPKLLTINRNESARAAQIEGLEPRKGMRMLFSVRDSNGRFTDKTGGKARGVKRKRDGEDEDGESEEE